MAKNQEKIDAIKKKMWRVHSSCTAPAPFPWATNAERYIYDRTRAAERYQELAARVIKELEGAAA